MDKTNARPVGFVASSVRLQAAQKQPKPKPADVVVIVGPELPVLAEMKADAARYGLRAHFVGTGAPGSRVAVEDIADLRERGILGPNTHVVLYGHGGLDPETKKHEIDLGRESSTTTEDVLREIVANGEHRGLIALSSCHGADSTNFSPQYDLGNSTLFVCGDRGLGGARNLNKTNAAIFKAIGKVRNLETSSARGKIDCMLTYVRCLTTEQSTLVHMKDDGNGGRYLFKAIESGASTRAEARQRYRFYRNKLHTDYGWKLNRPKYERRMEERLHYVLTKGGNAEALAKEFSPPPGMDVVLDIFQHAIFHPDFAKRHFSGLVDAGRFVHFVKTYLESSGRASTSREEAGRQRNFLEFCVDEASREIVVAALHLKIDGVEVFNPFERGPTGLSAFDRALERKDDEILRQCGTRIDKSNLETACRDVDISNYNLFYGLWTKRLASFGQDAVKRGIEGAIAGAQFENLKHLLWSYNDLGGIRFEDGETILHVGARMVRALSGGKEVWRRQMEEFFWFLRDDIGKIVDAKGKQGMDIYAYIDRLFVDEDICADLKNLVNKFADR